MALLAPSPVRPGACASGEGGSASLTLFSSSATTSSSCVASWTFNSAARLCLSAALTSAVSCLTLGLSSTLIDACNSASAALSLVCTFLALRPAAEATAAAVRTEGWDFILVTVQQALDRSACR